MGYPRKRKRAYHDYKNSRQAIEYTLKEAPLKAREALKDGDTRSACVQMKRRAPLNTRQVGEEIAKHNHWLDEHLIQYVLSHLQEVVVSALRQGIGVNFDDFISIKPAFEGRVDPNRPYDVKNLPLVAKATFAPAFTDALNKRGVEVHYAKGLKPTEVTVTRIEPLTGGDFHRAHGKFHNIQSLSVDLIEGERVTPCKLGLLSTGSPTKNHGKALTLEHRGHVPTTPYAFRFMWYAPTGKEETLTIPGAKRTQDARTITRH